MAAFAKNLAAGVVLRSGVRIGGDIVFGCVGKFDPVGGLGDE
jgi:hypothetical protein